MSPSLLSVLAATVVVSGVAAGVAMRATRRPLGVARSLAAKGTNPSQIARQLRLAEDVVGMLAATAESRIQRLK